MTIHQRRLTKIKITEDPKCLNQRHLSITIWSLHQMIERRKSHQRRLKIISMKMVFVLGEL